MTRYLISWLFWVWFLNWKQVTRADHNKDSIIQACNFIKRDPQHMWFPAINAKFLRTLILKNIYERLLLKIYPVLMFWFLEDISEVAVCRCSTKKRICRSPFSVKFFSKVFSKFSKQISLTQSLMLERYISWVET